MRGPLRGRQSAQGQHRSDIIGLTFAGVAEHQDARTAETIPLSTFDTAETDPRKSSNAKTLNKAMAESADAPVVQPKGNDNYWHLPRGSST